MEPLARVGGGRAARAIVVGAALALAVASMLAACGGDDGGGVVGCDGGRCDEIDFCRCVCDADYEPGMCPGGPF